ncbi:MAG: 2-oxoacid:acceptor oxidoreductase subunit alpha [Oligoflexales bacterium]|nr:2-oxoacid:acceptor oxidoreductase subunit alpha [Oligoflexales bacterium]
MKNNNSKKSTDFVVRFANVNGSGSATANTLFAKIMLDLGADVAIHNIFPSNIQGLPTWFEVRISDAGYHARKGVTDILVAMNVNSLAADVKSLASGAKIIYDSSRHLLKEEIRDDVEYIALPVQKLALEAIADGRSRLLLQNMIYVGGLLQLFGISVESTRACISRHYKQNTKLIDSNLQAMNIGYAALEEMRIDDWPFEVKIRSKKLNRILIDGNEAAAIGCVAAGATVASWYPITPSTSLIDAFRQHCKSFRRTPDGEQSYAVVQAEDEIAALGMVLGAGWNGARAFTATSGPGVSLMTELLGFAFYAEIPLVLFNIQRCGPSTGMPTRTQQADLLSTVYSSHGDTQHVLLFPKDPYDCFMMSIRAFDLADRLQTPVIVMSDLDIGMNLKLSPNLAYPKEHSFDRGKILRYDELEKMKEPYFRYLDKDGDGVPYRSLPGSHPSKGAYLTRGSGHDRFGKYTENSESYSDNLARVFKKFILGRNLFPESEIIIRDKTSPLACLYFGSSHDAVVEVLDRLRAEDTVVNSLRITAFPFRDEVKEFISQHKKIFIVEQNYMSQMQKLLAAELGFSQENMRSICLYDGQPISSEQLYKKFKEHL